MPLAKLLGDTSLLIRVVSVGFPTELYGVSVRSRSVYIETPSIRMTCYKYFLRRPDGMACLVTAERVREHVGGGPRCMLAPAEGGQRGLRLHQGEGPHRSVQKHHRCHRAGDFGCWRF